MKLRFIKNKKELPEALKKGLLPSEAFLVRGKKHFLAAFDASGLSRGPAEKNSIFTTTLKFGIGIMAVIAVVASASAYADNANVAADSPLYPLKRLGENVQLILAPHEEQIQLQNTFTARRINEIDDLQARHPSSTLIPALTSNLEQDMSSSLSAATKIKVDTGVDTDTDLKPLKKICDVFSRLLGKKISLDADLTTRFGEQCQSDENQASTTIVTASSTPNSSSTSSSDSEQNSENDSSDNHSNHNRDHENGNNDHHDTELQASTTIIVPPIQIPELPL